MHSVCHFENTNTISSIEYNCQLYFLCFQMLIMLSIMNKVADDDVQTAGRIFDRYDMDGDGTLSQDELGSHLESDVGRSGNKRRMSFSEAVMTVVNSMRHEQDHAPLTENSNIEDGQSHAPYVEMM